MRRDAPTSSARTGPQAATTKIQAGLGGGRFPKSRHGRANGSDVKLRGQGPRGYGRAARRLPACEGRDAGGVTPRSSRRTSRLGRRAEAGPRQLLRRVSPPTHVQPPPCLWTGIQRLRYISGPTSQRSYQQNMLTPEHAAIEAAVELIAHYVDPWVEKILGNAIAHRELQSAKNQELFIPYFKTVVPRCAHTKTLLYRFTPMPLDQFYVDLDLRAPNGRRVSTADISRLFSEEGPSLLITGTAGCGKSTLLKHLFLQCIDKQLGVPLFVELRHFSDFDGDFAEFLFTTVVANNLNISRRLFDELVAHGRFILFLDGFDEIIHSRARIFAKQLEQFDGWRQNLRTVVTSRPDYGYTFMGWHSFKELSVLPLTQERSLELINRLAYDEDAKAVFLRNVSAGLYETHRSFLESPLLATLMLMMSQHFGKIHSRHSLFLRSGL